MITGTFNKQAPGQPKRLNEWNVKFCIYFSYNFSFIGCYQTTLRSKGEHNLLRGYLISPYPC